MYRVQSRDLIMRNFLWGALRDLARLSGVLL